MNLDSWIDEEFLTTEAVLVLAEHYANAKPFPHIALRGILKKARYAQLKKALQNEKFYRKEADLFSFHQTADLFSSKHAIIKEFLKLLSSAEFTKWLGAITDVQTKRKVDAAGFLYQDTDYLLCHDDGLSSRRIAYVMNFSTLKTGALALYASDKKNKPTKIAKQLFPYENTLALFTVSKRSHHTVEEVMHEKRLTIAGWFHG